MFDLTIGDVVGGWLAGKCCVAAVVIAILRRFGIGPCRVEGAEVWTREANVAEQPRSLLTAIAVQVSYPMVELLLVCQLVPVRSNRYPAESQVPSQPK